MIQEAGKKKSRTKRPQKKTKSKKKTHPLQTNIFQETLGDRENIYKIIQTKANGDCFFDTIKKSYGAKFPESNASSIQRLRELVANNIDQNTLNLWKEMILEVRNQVGKDHHLCQ